LYFSTINCIFQRISNSHFEFNFFISTFAPAFEKILHFSLLTYHFNLKIVFYETAKKLWLLLALPLLLGDYEKEEETLKILKGIETRFTVKMYNLMQEVVAEGISKNGKTIELNVSNLPSGIYAVLIMRADKVEQMTVMVE
jgi:hypothetical protein